jgi:hypothetical protein
MVLTLHNTLQQYDVTVIRCYSNTMLQQYDVTAIRRYSNTTLLMLCECKAEKLIVPERMNHNIISRYRNRII